ncbi:MAG: hypothetical protein P8M73_03950 [Luminiphilus sp.]|jgi:hypothetical protein|nr:hypothetical protein [Luminiphilus sp.]
MKIDIGMDSLLKTLRKPEVGIPKEERQKAIITATSVVEAWDAISQT